MCCVHVCTYVRVAVCRVYGQMDFSEYIPVLCQTDGSFRGKSYWEKVSSVVGHNGKSVEKPVIKSDFVEGDVVVICFDGQDYKGVVEYGEPDITTRSQSPAPIPVEIASSLGDNRDSAPVTVPSAVAKIHTWTSRRSATGLV